MIEWSELLRKKNQVVPIDLHKALNILTHAKTPWFKVI